MFTPSLRCSPPVCEGESEGEVWVRSGEGEASDVRGEARRGRGEGAPEIAVGCAELVSTVVSSWRVAEILRERTRRSAVSGGGGGGAVRALNSQGGGAVAFCRKRACESGRIARLVHAFIAHRHCDWPSNKCGAVVQRAAWNEVGRRASMI
eukprot:scaffold115712_cov63-Phaeocystis_antarctica.AAC.3